MQRALRLLVLLALLVLPARAPAAAPLIDWTGTSWSGTAIFSVKASGAGSQKTLIDMDLDFGPQTVPLLGADQFRIEFDDGTTTPVALFGTWSLDAKGRPILALDTVGVADGIWELFAEVCDEIFGSTVCAFFDDVDVVIGPKDFKIKLKPKTVEGIGVGVAANGKLKFAFEYQGERLLRITFGFKSEEPLLGD